MQVKHHPSSVDLELVKRLLVDTKCKTLKDFLRVEFSNVSSDIAGGSGLPMSLILATHFVSTTSTVTWSLMQPR